MAKKPESLTILPTMMPLKGMKFAPYNPRVIEDEEFENLKNSIREFKLVENLVWNKKTGHVVGGNQRLKALRDIGVSEAPVIVVDLPLTKEKALNLALNRISGDWDYSVLREVIASINAADRGLSGFNAAEISAMVDNAADAAVAINDEYQNHSNLTGSESPRTPVPPPPPGVDDASYVVYLTFATKEAADGWLQSVLELDGIKDGKRTKVVVMS